MRRASGWQPGAIERIAGGKDQQGRSLRIIRPIPIRSIRVTLRIEKQYQSAIRTEATARLERIGLGGERVVNIQAAREGEADRCGRGNPIQPTTRPSPMEASNGRQALRLQGQQKRLAYLETKPRASELSPVAFSSTGIPACANLKDARCVLDRKPKNAFFGFLRCLSRTCRTRHSTSAPAECLCYQNPYLQPMRAPARQMN